MDNYISYAVALYSCCDKNNTLNIYNQANDVKNLIKASPSFVSFIKNRTIEASNRKKFAIDCLKTLNISQILIDFICVIIDNHKAYALIDILESFINYINNKEGYSNIVVISASQLENNLKNQIKNELKNIFNSNILIEFEIDQKLISGLKIKVGSTTYDNSVLYKLNEIKNQLKQKGEK